MPFHLGTNLHPSIYRSLDLPKHTSYHQQKDFILPTKDNTPNHAKMWPINRNTRRASPNTFHVVIRIDTLEAQRRLQNLYARGLPTAHTIRAMVAPVDPDELLWQAFVDLETDLQGAYDELQCGRLPERAYLAAGIMLVERVFRKIKTFLRQLGLIRREHGIQEGWVLRAGCLIADIEHAREELEEMRTRLLKELSGPLPQLALTMGGNGWAKFWNARLHGRRDMAVVKQAEGAYPYKRVPVPRQEVDHRYYL